MGKKTENPNYFQRKKKIWKLTYKFKVIEIELISIDSCNRPFQKHRKQWRNVQSYEREVFLKNIQSIRDTKGKFNEKMGSVKDRNGMDLTVAEDIKKSWQEYTKEQNKKDLHDPDNHNGVITHLEPDILECESSGP